jgi:tetratricopeptide (TPR) repeat protein
VRLLNVWLTSLTTVLLLVATPAFAENKELAKEAYHEGTLQYDLGEFRAALAAFKRAYLNFEDPVILFNIAQCQRQLGDKAEALRSYRVFLTKVPNTKQRPQVEKIIAELQAAIDHDRAATTHPPIGMMPSQLPGTTEHTAEAPAPSPQPAAAEPAPPTKPAEAVVVAAPPHAEKPLTKKGWFWGVVVGGVVVVAGAITLGVVLGTEKHQSFTELTY